MKLEKFSLKGKVALIAGSSFKKNGGVRTWLKK
jgi:hypothetical protein